MKMIIVIKTCKPLPFSVNVLSSLCSGAQLKINLIKFTNL